MTDGGASDEERVLLVEGHDDLHVVRNLSRSSSKMPPFSIREKDGVPALARSIRGEILVINWLKNEPPLAFWWTRITTRRPDGKPWRIGFERRA
jgi:hypothetical protein